MGVSNLKPRKQKDQAVFIERPIRSIGRFFKDLPRDEQKKAKEWARTAGSLPRPVLEAEYYRLERVVEYANYI